MNLRESLAANKYELVIDLQNNFRSRLLLQNLGSPIKRFKKHSIKKFLLVNFKINLLKNLPPIPERYISTVPGLTTDDYGLEFYTAQFHNKLLKKGEKIIGFCPGSRHFTKMWKSEYFISLGKLLIKNSYSVVLFGGKDDQAVCSAISAEIEGSINLCSNNDVFQTAADMKTCKAIVCNDSGLMHLASAMKIPVVAIFGSTVREFGFVPYKNRNEILENNSLSCRPCSHVGKDICPKGHFKCMIDILPEKVFQKIEKIIIS